MYHTLVLLSDYQTNLTYDLPHTFTITTLSDLIYHTIYDTLVHIPKLSD